MSESQQSNLIKSKSTKTKVESEKDNKENANLKKEKSTPRQRRKSAHITMATDDGTNTDNVDSAPSTPKVEAKSRLTRSSTVSTRGPPKDLPPLLPPLSPVAPVSSDALSPKTHNAQQTPEPSSSSSSSTSVSYTIPCSPTSPRTGLTRVLSGKDFNNTNSDSLSGDQDAGSGDTSSIDIAYFKRPVIDEEDAEKPEETPRGDRVLKSSSSARMLAPNPNSSPPAYLPSSPSSISNTSNSKSSVRYETVKSGSDFQIPKITESQIKGTKAIMTNLPRIHTEDVIIRLNHLRAWLNKIEKEKKDSKLSALPAKFESINEANTNLHKITDTTGLTNIFLQLDQCETILNNFPEFEPSIGELEKSLDFREFRRNLLNVFYCFRLFVLKISAKLSSSSQYYAFFMYAATPCLKAYCEGYNLLRDLEDSSWEKMLERMGPWVYMLRKSHEMVFAWERELSVIGHEVYKNINEFKTEYDMHIVKPYQYICKLAGQVGDIITRNKEKQIRKIAQSSNSSSETNPRLVLQNLVALCDDTARALNKEVGLLRYNKAAMAQPKLKTLFYPDRPRLVLFYLNVNVNDKKKKSKSDKFHSGEIFITNNAVICTIRRAKKIINYFIGIDTITINLSHVTEDNDVNDFTGVEHLFIVPKSSEYLTSKSTGTIQLCDNRNEFLHLVDVSKEKFNEFITGMKFAVKQFHKIGSNYN